MENDDRSKLLIEKNCNLHKKLYYIPSQRSTIPEKYLNLKMKYEDNYYYPYCVEIINLKAVIKKLT